MMTLAGIPVPAGKPDPTRYSQGQVGSGRVVIVIRSARAG